MTKVNLLEALRDYTEQLVSDMLLPVQMQEDDEKPPAPRAPGVYVGGLAAFSEAKEKVPYIFHQVFTAQDRWDPARHYIAGNAVVRSVFAVYHEDNAEGQMSLLGLLERVRLGILRKGIVGGQFRLDYELGVECVIYPNNITPFYAGEMISTWNLPPVEREVNYDKKGYSNIK